MAMSNDGHYRSSEAQRGIVNTLGGMHELTSHVYHRGLRVARCWQRFVNVRAIRIERGHRAERHQRDRPCQGDVRRQARAPVKDSAGYVAVERVTGTLNGQGGSFLLLHRGVMNRGAQSL